MKAPRFTLVTDGPTDGDMLVPILEWLLRSLCPNISIKVEYADVRGRPIGSKGLSRKIEFALNTYPCNCLFVHRDAEKEPPDNRRQEVQRAIAALESSNPPPYVCVVPIRMSEAWLLFDEPAIRRAAGNPNGKVPLEIPRLSAVEGLPDPKHLLYGLLTTGSELSGRRRKSFDPRAASRRVAELIDDFDRLRQLAAFQMLESEVQKLVQDSGWDQPV